MFIIYLLVTFRVKNEGATSNMMDGEKIRKKAKENKLGRRQTAGGLAVMLTGLYSVLGYCGHRDTDMICCRRYLRAVHLAGCNTKVIQIEVHASKVVRRGAKLSDVNLCDMPQT